MENPVFLAGERGKLLALCIWINELKWCSVRILLWWERAHSALENSMLAFFVKQFAIRDSGHRKNARVRLHQLARPIEVVSC